MTEAEAFLAAIIANPDDDLPRLVFADWLDEHDDSLRAEFIRGQCALAAGSTDIELAKRMVIIEAANRRKWSMPGVAHAIASSEAFRKLRRLSLAGNRILPSVAMVLRNWITSKESLKCIDLRRCEIDAESLAILEGDARVLLDPKSDEER